MVSSDHSIEALMRKGRNGWTRRSGNGQANGRIFRCKESVGNDSMGVKRQQIDEDQFLLSLERGRRRRATAQVVRTELKLPRARRCQHQRTYSSYLAVSFGVGPVCYVVNGQGSCWVPRRGRRCGHSSWQRPIDSILLQGPSRVRYKADCMARAENGC